VSAFLRFLSWASLVVCGLFTAPGQAETFRSDQLLDEVHFLIPAGPGGGWDGTARGIGEALRKSGLVEKVSYENLSGGGGGRAIARLIETADRQQNTLLISSTPIVVRSLQGIFPQSFRDLRVIGSVIADYTAILVRADSPHADFNSIAASYQQDPRSVKIAGGSVRGSTDHFVVAKALQLAGGKPRSIVYVAYDGGGKAMAGLLTGECDALSTGLSEAIEMHRAGEVRILAITAPQRLKELPDVPTLTETGLPLTFANWRGFFAAPGLEEQRYKQMINTVEAVVGTAEFEEIRSRNGWSRLQLSDQAFYDYLEQQEQEIGELMRQLGYLRQAK
jgi:putative tricarboxylic transport membrane protein|tara:strand:- start:4144 stop:5145 length:1002 start_codon:yes stop_codon:yes gene_type:complete